MRWFAALLVVLGVQCGSALARALEVELDFQHVGGMLHPAELDAWLASPDLAIEAIYHPLKLIEGKTATRIRTMPIGSRLHPILHTVALRGAQIERAGRVLRFRVEEQMPGREGYRLMTVSLRAPITPGIGRPQPALTMILLHKPPQNGAHQAALSGRYGTFDLGERLRYRWSDARGEPTRQPLTCGGDVREIDAERYRFRPRHRYAGLLEVLASDVQSDPPAVSPAGRQSLRMREPYPPPIAGWRLSRNHLIRVEIGNARVDRLSIYGEQPGTGQCRRTLAYEALFAGEQAVSIERSLSEYDCEKTYRPSQIVRAEWLEDGSLARYLEGSGANPSLWDAFSAGQPAACDSMARSPDVGRAEALQAEVRQLRDAFVAR